MALAAVAAAMGAVQVATIAKQKFADGGLLQGKSHAQGGIPVGNTNIEVEGNEWVINKNTSMKNLDLLDYINSKKKKLDLSDFVEFYSSGSKRYAKGGQIPKTIFADGGTLPTAMNAPEIDYKKLKQVYIQDERPIVASIVEINDVQNRVRKIQAVAGIEQ